MPPRKVIPIGEAAHTIINQTLKKGASVTHPPKRTPEQAEALRLRVETAARENHDFGKKTAKAVTDESSSYMADDVVSDRIVGDGELNPTVIDQLGQMGSSLTGMSIMEEIQSDRITGKLRPFTEGEPIGTIQQHKRGPAPPLKTRNDYMDERQKELRERQRRNDATLERLAKRYS